MHLTTHLTLPYHTPITPAHAQWQDSPNLTELNRSCNLQLEEIALPPQPASELVAVNHDSQLTAVLSVI